jgi:hypothetical protein
MADAIAADAPGYGAAAVGPGGFSTAFVSGVITSSNFDSATLTASVTETADIVIPDIGGVYEVTFSFQLFDMFVEFWDRVGLEDDPIAADLSYAVRLDGAERYAMRIRTSGSRDAPEISVGCSLGVCPGIVPEATAPGDVPRRLDFLPISETDYVLGRVFGTTSGETFEIETFMRVSLTVQPFALDSGGRAGLSDPNSLALRAADLVKLDRIGPTPVPLPASLWALPAAFGMLGAYARRRAQAGSSERPPSMPPPVSRALGNGRKQRVSM